MPTEWLSQEKIRNGRTPLPQFGGLMNDLMTTELSNHPGSGWLVKNQNLNRGNMIEEFRIIGDINEYA